MGDASRRPRATHEFEIDTGLARLQAHSRCGERPFAKRARRARLGRTRRLGESLGKRTSRSGSLGFGGLGFGRRLGRLLRPRFRRSGDNGIRQAWRVDADELGADREHLADRAAERQHVARDGRRDVDGRLVGHHGSDDLILVHEIADLDRPLDDLRFRHAFANVRHLDRAGAHHEASIAFKSARPTRAGPGK